MFQECRYILSSGYKCKSPALRGLDFCYYHDRAHRYRHTPVDCLKPLPLPPVDDPAGIQIAINQVVRQLSLNRLDRAKAGTLLYGLQLAARLAKNSNQKPAESIREITQTPPGIACDEIIDLAPEKTTCEPPDDCVDCGRRDFCKDFELWENKVEELEYFLEAEREAMEQTEPDENDCDNQEDLETEEEE
jgi:hypothetical protein